ncbi:MAG: hypothetical protein OEY63_03175 [Gemmatimonadota bacterium]|nr:hypothetical protein [Gemmatimonadota bacterium]
MGNRINRLAAVGALIGGLSAVGCDAVLDQTAEDLDLAITESTATVVADAVIRDLGHMYFGGGGMMGDFESSSAMTTTVSTTRTVTFFDADGLEQGEFDPVTTASIHIHVVSEGSADRNGWSGEFSRERDMVVSGLEGTETSRVWNGTGNASVVRSSQSDEFGTRTFDMTMDMTMEDVTRGLPRTEFPWPLSGTITRHVVVQIVNGPNGNETRELTVIVEFNGTQFASMTVNGETFDLDLAARQGERAHRNR